MTKRPLNDKERKITKSNLKRQKDELGLLKLNKEYNEALLAKQEYLRKFDDDWRDYLREKKDEEDKKVLDMIQREIDETNFVIDKAEKELKEGTDLPEAVE